MKLSSMVCASTIALAAVVFKAEGAFAAVNYNSSKSNQGNISAQSSTACPTGQEWNVTAKKCVAPAAVVNTTTRSNTQHNIMAPAPNTTTPPPK
jgi:hypothetical protein